MHWRLKQSLFGLFILTFLGTDLARAQSTPDAVAKSMSLSAESSLQSGDTQKAIAIYEEIVSKFKTFPGIWTVRYNLGFAYYISESYDKAIKLFKEIEAQKNIDPLLNEQATLILGSVYSAQADTKKDAERDRLLTESIQLYDHFLKDHPTSKLMGEALYSKAGVFFQMDKLTEAEKTLLEFFDHVSQSPIRAEATYLLAIIYGAQAKQLKAEAKSSEAKSRLEEAKKHLEAISRESKDPLLSNKALYSAGDILLQVELYPEAIAYFRKVRPKKYLEDQQFKKTEEIRLAKIQAIKSGDKMLENDLARQYDRASQHLNTIRNKTDLFLDAQRKIAECFYKQGKYDEVLIISRYFFPHFDGEQRKRAYYIMVKALIEKKEPEKAIKNYDEFKTAYSKDPMGEEILFALSDYFYRVGKYEASVKWGEEYKTIYPGGSLEEQIYFTIASAYTAAKDLKKAEEANEIFRKKFPKSALASAALFNKAYAIYSAKDFPAAEQAFRQYIKDFPQGENVESAAFLIGVSLYERQKYDEAILEFQNFEKKYLTSKQLPNVLYRLALSFDKKKDVPHANAIYARIVKSFSTEEVAPASQFSIGQNLTLNPKSYLEAIATFEEFVKLFPTHSHAPIASYSKAQLWSRLNKSDEAIAAYQELIEKYPDSDPASESYLEIGEILSQKASALAQKPEKLPLEKQELWKKYIQQALSSYEEILKKYPDKPVVDKALSELSNLWQARVRAKFSTETEAFEAFEKLAKPTNLALQNKIAFTRGSLLVALGKSDDALKVLDDAFEKSKEVSLPNEGYKQYRDLLIAQKKFDKIITISKKQLSEKQAANDLSGIAEAHLGLGQAYFEKEDFIKATEYLNEVMNKYPWHETAAPEAEFYKAWIEEKKKNYEEAIKLYNVLSPKIRDPELKVIIYMRLGYSWEGLANSHSAGREKSLKEALGYFTRIGTAFTAYPTLASEGLYKAAEIFERLTPIATDPKFKNESLPHAIKFYKRCIEEHSNTVWAQKAKERLKGLEKP